MAYIYLRKRGYWKGKDSCFLQGLHTAKLCNLPAATLHAKETIFWKAHVHIFKGTRERFSPDSSWMPLSGTTMDFTQIIPSFNSLCQPVTSAGSLPHGSPSGIQICPEKEVSLVITFCHLFPLYSTQINKRGYSSSPPALPSHTSLSTEPHRAPSCCCRGYVIFRLMC